MREEKYIQGFGDERRERERPLDNPRRR
jgi:hypothetical protein